MQPWNLSRGPRAQASLPVLISLSLAASHGDSIGNWGTESQTQTMAGLQKYLSCSACGEKAGEEASMEALQAQLALSLRFQSGDYYGGLRKWVFTPPPSAQHLGGWGAALQGSDGDGPGDVRI